MDRSTDLRSEDCVTRGKEEISSISRCRLERGLSGKTAACKGTYRGWCCPGRSLSSSRFGSAFQSCSPEQSSRTDESKIK